MHTIPGFSLPEFLDLSYHSDQQILTVRWLRAVSFNELQTGFAAAREQGYTQNAARWLVDVRRRTELDATSSSWVARELLPAVAADVVPATLHVAYLLSPARAEVLRQDAAMRATMAAAQAPTQPYHLQTFLDEVPAVRWLLQPAS
ncbi:hypothetical protein [Hymenobacter swuensis]|uniref:Uncharacterized protein n=1 Tax=Hymenobacter swuensis DY53 TaxID=1227739 RepID=W8EVI2_9BACT|nr:hypothetical protein [Hymenobacter swuensis]AHJ96523.1 hypothetical protein Hsw_0928 [Hymenobacter swuensis DY53]